VIIQLKTRKKEVGKVSIPRSSDGIKPGGRCTAGRRLCLSHNRQFVPLYALFGSKIG